MHIYVLVLFIPPTQDEPRISSVATEARPVFILFVMVESVNFDPSQRVFRPQSSVMMNCQAPRKPYRVSQMTTIFITLLCFPSFLGASVCVTYTMWRYVNLARTRR